MLVETAGGPLSPSPSGALQCDVYRPLRLPVLLVLDHKLGGISTSIAAYESLRIRGYDLAGFAIFGDEHYGNAEYLAGYMQERTGAPFLRVRPPPEPSANDYENMVKYYEHAISSEQPKDALNPGNFVTQLIHDHESRCNTLLRCPAKRKRSYGTHSPSTAKYQQNQFL